MTEAEEKDGFLSTIKYNNTNSASNNKGLGVLGAGLLTNMNVFDGQRTRFFILATETPTRRQPNSPIFSTCFNGNEKH